jgi:hypothetical protein
MVKCGVLFEVWTEFLIVTYTSSYQKDGRARPGDLHSRKLSSYPPIFKFSVSHYHPLSLLSPFFWVQIVDNTNVIKELNAIVYFNDDYQTWVMFKL